MHTVCCHPCPASPGGRIVTQSQLAQAVWDQDFVGGTNVVEAQVPRLRRKIDEPGQPSLIQTVRGSGYMMEDQQPPPL